LQEYTFTARDDSGKSVINSLRAKSQYEALAQLKGDGLTVISIEPLTSKRKVKFVDGKSTAAKKRKTLAVRKRVTSQELSAFCRQLSVSINSGVPLMESLGGIAEDMDSPYFKQILLEIVDDIHKGGHFSDAIAKYKNVFTPVFIALVRSAEESGSLNQVFEYLSQYLEKGVRLKQKIQSITAYPLFILVFFVIVVFIVTIFILPRFESIFMGLGAKLPTITRVIFGMNRFFINNLIWFILSAAAFVAAFIIYSRTERGGYNVDKLKLRLPIFGSLIKKYSIARLCRVLAIMIQGGVSIETAIEISSQACGNKVLERSLGYVREQIITGAGIAASLRHDDNFPSLVLRMIGIGESSAQLPQVLNRVSDMYEDQVEGSTMVLTSLFEPIVIIVFGGVVLMLVLAIYLPIFSSAMGMR
jgi:type II secretory pathway component PulF